MIVVDVQDEVITIEAPARLAPIIGRIPGVKVKGQGWSGPASMATLSAVAVELSSLDGFDPTATASAAHS